MWKAIRRASSTLALCAIGFAHSGCNEKGDAPPSCDGVTCSGNGTCAVVGDQAVCVCDPGFGPSGEACLACGDIPSADYAIDIPTVRLYGAFTVAGVAPPLNDSETGDIWLESAEHGRVRLGSTHEQSYVRKVLAGTYDVYYARLEGGAVVPLNAHALIGTLDVYKSGRADIDVPVTDISGAITLNGAAPPAGENEDGVIALVNTTNGDHAIVGNTHDGSFAARVVPGTYDVRYLLESGGSVVPANRNAWIDAVSIPTGGPIDVDLVKVDLTGAMTLNSAAFPVSEFEDGNLYLAGTDGKDRVLLGNTHIGDYDVPVLVGTYDVYYELESGGVVVPANQWGRVGGTTTITPLTTVLDIDVESFVLAGRFLVDGLLPPASEYEDALVYLRSGGDEILLGNTHSIDFIVHAIGGTFDVVYELETGGTTVPLNSGARIMEKIVNANDSAFFIDIVTGVFTGDILFNGIAPPLSEYDDGQIVVENVATGDRAVLANSHDLDIDARLVRGLYDLYYEVETPGDVGPTNEHAYLGTLDLDTASVDQPVSLSVFGANGAILLNGETPPISEYDDGLLFLRDLAGVDSAPLANSHDVTYETRLIAKTYDVFYSVETPGGAMPENVDGRIGCFAVDGL